MNRPRDRHGAPRQQVGYFELTQAPLGKPRQTVREINGSSLWRPIVLFTWLPNARDREGATRRAYHRRKELTGFDAVEEIPKDLIGSQVKLWTVQSIVLDHINII